MTITAWDIMSWVIIIFLVCLSGLFSGLNLGLMGLDPIGLQIIMAGDNSKNKKCAKKIEPLRRRGNWLLCTLLLGNVSVNAALSILLAEKSSGLVGFFISTALITIFGEIVPQALCSRYALEVGSRVVWFVWPMMFLLGFVAYPIAWLLDKALGDELGTIYSNKELQKLVEIHANTAGTGVNTVTEKMLKGALGLKDAIVKTCMTEMGEVFWLNDESKLTFDVLTEIFKSGHSRIPIFNTSDKFGRIRCVGILFVKDLILLDPDDEMPVTQIMNAFKHKTPPIVWKDDTLQTALQIFTKTSQHLAFVQDVVKNTNLKGGSSSGSSSSSALISSDTARISNTERDLDNTYEYVGILTLEDVIEHVLQTQLIDEHDNFIDNKHLLRTNRLNRIDWTMLHIFDHRDRVLTTLPPQELQAVYHFLSQTIKPFTPKNRLVSEASIKNLLATSSVIRVVVEQDDQFSKGVKFGRKIMGNLGGDDNNFTQRDPYKDIEDNGLLLYQRDKKTRYFTLLLDGKCEIYAGRQGFRCELTRWSYLCPDALDHCVECHRYHKPLLDYVPDFTCKIIQNSRVLRIKLVDFKACLEGKFDFDASDKTVPNSPMTPHIPQLSSDGAMNNSNDTRFGYSLDVNNLNDIQSCPPYPYPSPVPRAPGDDIESKTNNNIFHRKQQKKKAQKSKTPQKSVPENDSIFNERQPLMYSASDPHIKLDIHKNKTDKSHSFLPGNITDNSEYPQQQSSHNLNFNNNLGKHSHHQLHDDNDNNKQTIIEVDDDKYDHEYDYDYRHNYRHNNDDIRNIQQNNDNNNNIKLQMKNVEIPSTNDLNEGGVESFDESTENENSQQQKRKRKKKKNPKFLYKPKQKTKESTEDIRQGFIAHVDQSDDDKEK